MVALGVGVVVFAAVMSQTTAPVRSHADLAEDTVVATLREGARPSSPALQAALRATRSAPQDREVAKSAARALIDEGRAAADSRLVGAALGVLRPFLATADAQTLYLAATARQYQHDFPGALDLLDKAVALAPADVNAILTRATIQTVLGRFDVARMDCQRLSALGRPEIGFLCDVTTRLLTADAPALSERLAQILARPGVLDPSLHVWAIGLLGEIAALHGDRDTARAHLAAVVASNPNALRERLLLADLLLTDGEAAAAEKMLAPAAPADGVLIRRVLVAQALGDATSAEAISADLAAQFKQNIDLGLTAHAREEALYYLIIAKDPETALRRALVNWDLQHEIEDAQLLVDAAIFADQPQAAAPVLDWMERQAVAVPTFRLPNAVREAAR